jgi:hypothetical protein
VNLRRANLLVAIAVSCGAASLAFAAQLLNITVDRESGRYTLYAETYLEAQPDDIFEVLLDYDRFSRLSSVYKEHGYLEPAEDGMPIVFTLMEGCVLFYCKSMRRVERLETRRPGFIRTETLPEQSDFKYGISEWTLESEASGTRMTYRLVMEPDFWVPPIIGAWYLKRTLESDGRRVINRIERLARSAAGSEPGQATNDGHRKQGASIENGEPGEHGASTESREPGKYGA